MAKVIRKNSIDVTIVKNKAYWIYNNTLYQADVDSKGDILAEKASPVDVINMSKNELRQIIKIVDSFNK